MTEQKGAYSLKTAPFQRILYKSGVKRISTKVYEKLQHLLHDYLSIILPKMILFCKNDNRKTIYSKDLKQTMQFLGIPIFSTLPNFLKKKNISNTSEKPTKFCFLPTVFERVIRYETALYDSSLRFSHAVFYLTQLVCEAYLISLCKKANLILAECKRETLFVKDFELVLKLNQIFI
jgi:histone H3/H4